MPMLNGLRYGPRTLIAKRLFAVMAMVSAALGISTNVAIYGLMDASVIGLAPKIETSS